MTVAILAEQNKKKKYNFNWYFKYVIFFEFFESK